MTDFEFFSWEFLKDRVNSPYEAVIALSKEARRLNTVPHELQEPQTEKKTTQAMMKMLAGELIFECPEK